MVPNSRKPSLVWAAALCVALPSFARANGADWIHSVKRNVLDRIQISGSRDLSLHWHKVTGDRTAFDTTNYYGQGKLRFTNVGNIQLEGRKVLGILNFRANIQDSRISDPQQEKLSLDYSKGNWDLNAGDLQPGLIRENRFANFNKTLKGFAATYKLKSGLKIQAVMSQVKGSVRTVSITGTNSSGPYYVGYSSLIAGSEQVMVNGQKLIAGADYVVDYVVGTITLIGRTLSVTDSMVVSFEAFSIGQQNGTVQGLEASYELKKSGRLTVTSLSQSTPGSGSAAKRLESFQGYGAPTIQYQLLYEPLTQSSVTVYLDGVLQALGTDYYFDTNNPAAFYFTRFVPATSTISVTYIPKPRSAVNGDRVNLGLGYHLPLAFRPSKDEAGRVEFGDRGYLDVNQTFGKLKGLTPSSGTARSITLALGGRKYDLKFENRKIPQGFVSVESVGFNRNEDGNDQTLVYRPNAKWKYELGRRNSSVLVTSGANTYSNRSNQVNLAANFNPGGSSFWTLSQGIKRNSTAVGESESNVTDFLKNDQVGSWSFAYGLTRQSGKAPINATTQQSFKTDGVKLQATYLGLGALTFSGSTRFLNIEQGARSGKAKEIELSSQYRFNPRSRLNLRYFTGNGGSISALNGYSNGDGAGYDGNGFAGGATGSALGGANTQLVSTSWDWQPSEKYGLTVDYAFNKYDGGITSNSETKTFSVASRADFGKGYTGNFALSRNNTAFIGSPAKSGTTTFAGSLEGSPKGRFSWSLSGNLFKNTGSGTFKQDGSSMYVHTGYLLHDRHRLMFDINSNRTTGSYAQDESLAALTYQYQIWRSIALNASFVHRLVEPKGSTAGGYRANSFDLGLSFSFGR